MKYLEDIYISINHLHQKIFFMNSSLFHRHRGSEEICNIVDTVYLFHELKIEKHKLFHMFLRKQMVKEYSQRILYSLLMEKQSKVQHQMRLQRLLSKTQGIKDYTLPHNKSLSQVKHSLDKPLELKEVLHSIVVIQYKTYNNF